MRWEVTLLIIVIMWTAISDMIDSFVQFLPQRHRKTFIRVGVVGIVVWLFYVAYLVLT